MSTASSAERRRSPGPLRRAARLALLGAVTAVLAQWVGVGAAAAAPALQSTGSSFAGPQIQSWTKNAAVAIGANINFQISSSVTGMQFFAQNQVDFGASDIPYSSGQSPATPNVPYQYLPDVAGGLSFMYNLNGNDGQAITNLNVNAAVIADIFLGRITYWDNSEITGINPQLAGDLPHTKILPFYRSDPAGENYLLSDYLLHMDGGTFTAAQQAFGIGNGGPAGVGSPSATWPTPVCVTQGNCGNSLSQYPGWEGTPTVRSFNSADGTASAVASNQGGIAYVETEYAHAFSKPVANLYNAANQYVQPTSLNIAIALEKAVLHQDLTQDLTGVYVNPLPGTYPLSSYSYFITQCSPQLAAAQNLNGCAADPGGASSTMAADRGAELGQFVDFIACQGQTNLLTGYSPIPPNLVQEDFWAIGRMTGGQQPPAPTAANCKNPYVDGSIPLPGEPVILGVAPPPTGPTPGITPGATNPGAHLPTGGKNGSSGGATGSGSTSGGSQAAVVARACASGKGAAAQGCNADGTLKSGYTVVNGQVVRTLNGGGGPNKYQRASMLLAATRLVPDVGALEVLGWCLLALALIAIPPVVVVRRRRTRARTAGPPSGGAPA